MVRTGVRWALMVLVSGLSVIAVIVSAGAATSTTVSSANNAKLGPILVAGKTVYTLQPSKTACTSACLKEWPAVVLPHGVKQPTAGSGVDASQLGTKKFAKNSLQITYAGKRLYWSAKDKKAGQVHGNVTNKWGTWSTVTAASNDSTTTTPAPTTVPATETPATAPPGTAAPQTSPPATSPPATAPPETSPPETQPTTPRTQPPPTTSPGNGGIGF